MCPRIQDRHKGVLDVRRGVQLQSFLADTIYIYSRSKLQLCYLSTGIFRDMNTVKYAGLVYGSTASKGRLQMEFGHREVG